MPRTTNSLPPKAVVLSRETDRLADFLHLRQSIDVAMARGKISKSKVAESWLYHSSAIGRTELIEAATAETDRILAQRLVVPLSVLAGMLSASMDPTCSKGAARALLHQLVAAGVVERLGLLTSEDEPYLAIYRGADTEEVTRQLNHIRASLQAVGHIDHNEMPDPVQRREGRAWASTLVEHGEFAGWGRLTNGSLRAWPSK
jgi:hypothetical protein